MKVKKLLYVEETLNEADYIAQRQDSIVADKQALYPNMIVKVTTFIAVDNKMIVSTTEENKILMGAGDKMLANRPLEEHSLLKLDDEMMSTYELTIAADTDLESYVMAIDVAQAKADQLFERNKTKMPIIEVIDYRWGNDPVTVTASVFGNIDVDGNTVPVINTAVPLATIGGNRDAGEIAMSNKTAMFLDTFSMIAAEEMPEDWVGDTGISAEAINEVSFEIKTETTENTHHYILRANYDPDAEEDSVEANVSIASGKMTFKIGNAIATTEDNDGDLCDTNWHTVKCVVDKTERKVFVFIDDVQYAEGYAGTGSEFDTTTTNVALGGQIWKGNMEWKFGETDGAAEQAEVRNLSIKYTV